MRKPIWQAKRPMPPDQPARGAMALLVCPLPLQAGGPETTAPILPALHIRQWLPILDLSRND